MACIDATCLPVLADVVCVRLNRNREQLEAQKQANRKLDNVEFLYTGAFLRVPYKTLRELSLSFAFRSFTESSNLS